MPVPLATLMITLRAEPSAPADAQATVVVDAESGRTTSHVPVQQPLQVAVPKGVAIVRAMLPGYSTIEGRAPLSAGCTATMTIVLPKAIRR